MGCDASWLGSVRAALATADRCRPSKRGRSPVSIIACQVADPSGPSAPRWYKPNGRRRWVRPPKPIRRWVEAHDPSSLSDSRGDRFVLLSYNILGDNNALYHRDLYLNIPFDVMKWDSRKEIVCQEISRWNADIVCLQEVDRYGDILSHMKKQGYAGSYKGRTGDNKDGCAIFWKERRFRLLEGDNIEFNAFGLRDNVAQLFVFEVCEAKSRRLVVGNIHVLFNPKRGDIKLGQIHMLLWKAHAISEKWGSIPIVLSGDFNSTPQSAIYEFLSTSELNISLHDRRYLSGQEKSGQEKSQPSPYSLPRLIDDYWTVEELKNANGGSECNRLTHPLKLRSSYACVRGNARTRGPSAEPLATTYHAKFLGTVDYHWYSSGLASSRVLDTLPLDTLQEIGGLPSKDIGSDHLALVSEFVFTDCRELEAQPPANIVATEEATSQR